MTELLRCLLPPPRNGDDPYPWRQMVGLTLAALVLCCFAMYALAFGTLERLFGFPARLAWAHEVDDRIEKTILPIERKLDAVQATNHAILRAIYIPQIRARVRERCDIPDRAQRDRINAELDRIRNEYRLLSGERLNVSPTCEEV